MNLRSTSTRRLLIRGAFLLGIGSLPLTGCTDARVYGNLLDPDVVAEIEPGVQRRQDVIGLLGSPSALSTFEDNTWFYIGQRMEKFAFFKPSLLERRILVVMFDEQGVVQETHNLTQADANDVDPTDRVTPTEGRDLTLLQQLFGNLGRFPTEQFERPSRF